MSTNRRVLPAPTWRGSPSNLLHSYIKFLGRFEKYQKSAALTAIVNEKAQRRLEIEAALEAIERLNAELGRVKAIIDEIAHVGTTAVIDGVLLSATQCEIDYQSLTDTKTHTIRSLRESQTRIRQLNAEIDQHTRDAKRRGNLINHEEARKELAFITTGVPGVMGLKFHKGAPVVHVRTSAVHENTRYDLGDFEITFSMDTRYVTQRVTPTRFPARVDGERLYWQGYDDGWFCFGERAEQLNTLFLQGSFSQFFHYTVNSLCEINEADLRYLQSYPIIPMDEVWINKPRQRARRPRQIR
jgi:hypothetical protein